jgi:hypothetical protein
MGSSRSIDFLIHNKEEILKFFEKYKISYLPITNVENICIKI